MRRGIGKVQFVLRHEDTGKIVGIFNVVDDAVHCQLVLGGAKLWAWKARDWSDGELNF